MDALLVPIRAFDLALLHGVLALADGPATLTWLLHSVTSVDLFKMAVLVGLALYVWLAPEGRLNGRAEQAVRGLLGLVLALVIDHAIQLLVHRMRPRFALPELAWPDYAMDWSRLVENAFPSDHAVLAFALVAIVWGLSRRLGMVALAWAVLGVCVPRTFFGFHWPTDLVGGALIGLGGVALARRLRLPPGAWTWLARLERRAPAAVILGLFLIGYECMVSFDSTRRALKMGRDVAKAVGIV